MKRGSAQRANKSLEVLLPAISFHINIKVRRGFPKVKVGRLFIKDTYCNVQGTLREDGKRSDYRCCLQVTPNLALRKLIQDWAARHPTHSAVLQSGPSTQDLYRPPNAAAALANGVQPLVGTQHPAG
jgi:hypothetical protein